jgi:hypothetical protein
MKALWQVSSFQGRLPNVIISKKRGAHRAASDKNDEEESAKKNARFLFKT